MRAKITFTMDVPEVFQTAGGSLDFNDLKLAVWSDLPVDWKVKVIGIEILTVVPKPTEAKE